MVFPTTRSPWFFFGSIHPWLLLAYIHINSRSHTHLLNHFPSSCPHHNSGAKSTPNRHQTERYDPVPTPKSRPRNAHKNVRKICHIKIINLRTSWQNCNQIGKFHITDCCCCSTGRVRSNRFCQIFAGPIWQFWISGIWCFKALRSNSENGLVICE